MSWLKRRGQPSPSPAGPGVPLYNPNQPVAQQQQQWQQVPFQQQQQQAQQPQQYANNWYSQSQTATTMKPPVSNSYQQLPPSAPQGYWQPYGQNQQAYNAQLNANQYQQGYPNQPNQYQYGNIGDQPNAYYQNTGYNSQNNTQMQNFPQQSSFQSAPQQNVPSGRTSVTNTVSETDAWNWGWDEANSNADQTKPVETQNIANQNNIKDSFVTNAVDDTWNWSVDDSNSSSSASNSYKTELAKKENAQKNLTQRFESTESNKEKSVWDEVSKAKHQSIQDQSEVNALVGYETSHSGLQQHIETETNSIQQNALTLDQLPALQTGRRAQNENLTPQWSIESQVSQDSSDGILLTSESDNRSSKVSRSSTVSQSPSLPVSGQDFSYENNTHFVESNNTDDKLNMMQGHASYMQQNILLKQSESASENHEREYIHSQISEISHDIQNLTLQANAQVENKEIVTPESSVAVFNTKNNVPLDGNQSENRSAPITPAQNKTPPLQPPPKNTPPLQPPPKNTPLVQQQPPKNTTPPLMPPPQNMSEGSFSQNPYKRTSMLSHKNANKFRTSPETFGFQPPTSMRAEENMQSFEPVSFNLPTTSNNPQGVFGLVENLGVNLETVPDNSERPDQYPGDTVFQTSQSSVRKVSVGQMHSVNQQQQQWPPVENCEIAPKNDRNQYLETGQLSDSDHLQDYNQTYESNINDQSDLTGDVSVEEPPPGLSRMVLGRTETESSLNLDHSNDGVIPSGLDRIIDGEPENDTVAPSIQPSGSSGNNDEPPIGLHRMVPGESSSPESRVSWPRSRFGPFVDDGNGYQSQMYDDNDNISESELRSMGTNIASQPSQRSETIGADTPPTSVSNNTYTDQSISSVNRNSAVGSDLTEQTQRETNVDGADTQEEIVPTPSVSDSVNQRGNALNRQTAVRDQTDGENTTDNNKPVQDKRSAAHNLRRSDSSEDDRDRDNSNERRRSKSPNRYDKERKYYDRDDRHDRDRDSPDRNRDRKHERRRMRDRYYDDDTDYYSDRDRREYRSRDRERDEYDRRYSSLKRDKERTGEKRKDKDRKDRHYDRDGRREDYYYDYYGRESHGSRPSSRTDSFRERERSGYEHPREHSRKHRDPYSPYYQGYGYGPYSQYYSAHYQQQYQYYENLRRNNPAAYAEWYRKYYQSGGMMSMMQPTGASSSQGYAGHDDGRASVHSGRSSANGELRKDQYLRHVYYTSQPSPSPAGGYYSQTPMQYPHDDSRALEHTDSSLNFEDSSVVTQRLTPAKFTTAHVKASISSGRFIRIPPHYPLDGQLATVEIGDLQQLLANDETQIELTEFPGPLIKGVTHKKTLIEYCENKIKRAVANSNLHDKDSYILMWDLLILLLRQNGVVVGTDIAELLMKNSSSSVSNSNSRRQSVVSSVTSVQEDLSLEQDETPSVPMVTSKHNKSSANLSEAFVTNKFREYLLYGSGKEALEWAMKHGLWGHALFLASKLDKRTYANVMMRFANGLTINDPLQTLYQLLSGRQPAAVTCVSDEKWGDWRPHLAMILSNTSQRPELDRKAITTLGDTLHSRGSIYAAQFCYIMAQVGFGQYGSKSARLVLLGSSHQRPFIEFATNDAIMMTEVYEYACSLSDAVFTIPEFQSYKYLLACRLAERGLLERALLYVERIATVLASNPSRYSPSLVSRVLQLAERLRPRDPTALAHLQLDSTEVEGDMPPTCDWIADLKAVLGDYTRGLITQDAQSNSNLASSELDIANNSQTPPVDPTPAPVQQFDQQQPTWNEPNHNLDQTYYQWSGSQQQPQWSSNQEAVGYNQPVDYQPNAQQINHEPSTDVYQQPIVEQQPNEQTQWGTAETVSNQQPQFDGSYGQQDYSNTIQQTDYWNTTAQNEPEPEVEDKAKDDVSTTGTNTAWHSGDGLRKRSAARVVVCRPLSDDNDAFLQAYYADQLCGCSHLQTVEHCDSDCECDNRRPCYDEECVPCAELQTLDCNLCGYTCKNATMVVHTDDDDDGKFNSRYEFSKSVEYQKEENSQIICYRDKDKSIAIKNDTTITKYNNVPPNTIHRNNTAAKTYRETEHDFEIDPRDCETSTFKMTKPRHKRDLICDTVDAWATNARPSNMFTNIRDSIFGSKQECIEYKPLVFNGTYPIDSPVDARELATDLVSYRRVGKFSDRGGNNLCMTYDIDAPCDYE